MSSPAPIRTEHVFTADVECDAIVSIGPSSAGVRQLVPITGGSFEGPRIRGRVLPGGADWQLVRPDGVLEIDARYTIQTDDGYAISVRNRGIVTTQPAERGSDRRVPYVRTAPCFEAPAESPYAWLNQSLFVGTVQVVDGPGVINVRVCVFRVL